MKGDIIILNPKKYFKILRGTFVYYLKEDS